MSSTSASWTGAASEPVKPRAATPVILNTDIGDDIDDTWALGLLLKCPELDVKLVVGDFGRFLVPNGKVAVRRSFKNQTVFVPTGPARLLKY
jgi:inosine-uridine nucleoside N-ribohydrolase